jgi:tRNA (adenine22-N1)-methyltransferase
MIKLSKRLNCIAEKVIDCESLADIGTDHGKLPISLLMNEIIKRAIFCDINEGPIAIAIQNINKENLKGQYEIRIGNGIEKLEYSEVDCIVIAGMGGLLIKDILTKDLKKTRSFKKIILQPRSNEEKLRKWILENSFLIVDEELVREGKFICQVITIDLSASDKQIDKCKFNNLDNNGYMVWEQEFSPILFKKFDPLLPELISRKIKIGKNIINEIDKANEIDKDILLERAQFRLNKLIWLLEKAENKEVDFWK